jgi:hypothetical protein
MKSILTACSVDHKKSLSALLLNEHGEPQQEIVDHIHAFSGGVPRAITNASLCCNEFKGASSSDVEASVVEQCQGSLPLGFLGASPHLSILASLVLLMSSTVSPSCHWCQRQNLLQNPIAGHSARLLLRDDLTSTQLPLA